MLKAETRTATVTTIQCVTLELPPIHALLLDMLLGSLVLYPSELLQLRDILTATVAPFRAVQPPEDALRHGLPGRLDDALYEVAIRSAALVRASKTTSLSTTR